MVKQTWQLFCLAAFLLFSTALMVWTFLPDKQNEFEVQIAPFELEEIEETVHFPVNTKLVFQFSKSAKLDKKSNLGVIAYLSEIEDAQEFAGSDIRLTHNILIETRLELYPARITPGETIKQPTNSNSVYEFFWKAEMLAENDYKGDIWVYYHFVPKEGGEVLRRPICAYPIEIESKKLLGISVVGVRRISLAGFFISVLLSGFMVSRGKRNKAI